MPKTTAPDLVLLTRRQTMELLRVSGKTFDKLIADGVVPPGLPFANRLRWSRAALVAHLNRRATEAAVSAAA